MNSLPPFHESLLYKLSVSLYIQQMLPGKCGMIIVIGAVNLYAPMESRHLRSNQMVVVLSASILLRSLLVRDIFSSAMETNLQIHIASPSHDRDKRYITGYYLVCYVMHQSAFSSAWILYGLWLCSAITKGSNPSHCIESAHSND